MSERMSAFRDFSVGVSNSDWVGDEQDFRKNALVNQIESQLECNVKTYEHFLVLLL